MVNLLLEVQLLGYLLFFLIITKKIIYYNSIEVHWQFVQDTSFLLLCCVVLNQNSSPFLIFLMSSGSACNVSIDNVLRRGG